MNPAFAIRAPRTIRSSIVAFLACAALMALLIHPRHVFSQSQAANPGLDQKRELAYAYHELAILLIKKGNLDEAMANARQIIQLHFPAEYEYKIAESLSIIAERLSEIRRFDLVQALLDEALKATELDVNKANLFKIKARMFLKAGDDGKAIEAWKRAIELEKRPIR